MAHQRLSPVFIKTWDSRLGEHFQIGAPVKVATLTCDICVPGPESSQARV